MTKEYMEEELLQAVDLSKYGKLCAAAGHFRIDIDALTDGKGSISIMNIRRSDVLKDPELLDAFLADMKRFSQMIAVAVQEFQQRREENQ